MANTYVDSKLDTKFGVFNIRVYAASRGHETVVLWRGHFSPNCSALVRVHSECLTGDVFCSLKCDCGTQLTKALKLISCKGGIIIYLRQEGRGIGLFEKLKAYNLQLDGYDTFEANVLLGHRPDPRSYEMVKTVLDDLEINRIRLVTNNPSKISEIAKLGVEVEERIPLISKSTKHNKKYLETKKKKFHHFLKNSTQHYFYQVHVDNPDQVNLIREFIKNKKKDPLLTVCVGVSADHHSLVNDREVAKVELILQSLNTCSDFIPVLHFSFRHSLDILNDLREIKKTWPSINRLQPNDLPSLDFSTLKMIFDLFSVDMPLSDENFDLVYKQRFRELLKMNRSFILLDNSKGRGVKEPKDSLMKKIDVLLSYGLNDIALCGGFGPDELDRYFEIRRHYRINFSIDAETNLKTHDNFDIEKIKLYLRQLMRFDDPKDDGIDQTRKFLEERRRSDWEQVTINENEFLVHSKVFHAGHFPSTAWFASAVSKLVDNDSAFCEIGCGSGVISCMVALSNPMLRVTATDVNPFASENTRLNAERLGLKHRIDVCTGDVLDNIQVGKLFDSIFWALPFGYLDPGKEIDLEETQVFDPGYRSIRKFFQTAKNHLTPEGRLLLGFSSDLGHAGLLAELAQEYHILLKKIDEKIMHEKSCIGFELLEGKICL